jgi:hypothetical protein
VTKEGGKVTKAAQPWRIPDDLLDRYADAQFEPLIVIAVIVGVGWLIKRVSDVWLDQTRPGGQVIDTRGGKVVVRVAPYLERGTLVLQSDKEVRVFRPNQRDEALKVLETALQVPAIK